MRRRFSLLYAIIGAGIGLCLAMIWIIYTGAWLAPVAFPTGFLAGFALGGMFGFVLRAPSLPWQSHLLIVVVLWPLAIWVPYRAMVWHMESVFATLPRVDADSVVIRVSPLAGDGYPSVFATYWQTTKAWADLSASWTAQYIAQGWTPMKSSLRGERALEFHKGTYSVLIEKFDEHGANMSLVFEGGF